MIDIKVIQEQVNECITEISRYSTIWEGQRVIITPIHFRRIISVSVGKYNVREFNYTQAIEASDFIFENLQLKEL